MVWQVQQLWMYILHGGPRLSSVRRVQRSVPANILLTPAAICSGQSSCVTKTSLSQTPPRPWPCILPSLANFLAEHRGA